MKLAIISHTEHYKTDEDTIVGWGPTVNEINHLLDIFDEIYHIAMLHKGEAPPSSLSYNSNKITFIPIPVVGGITISSKLYSIRKAPKIIGIVSKTLKQVDYFQLRTPSGIGVFLIPYLTFFVKTKGWYKYAGNWNQKKPPLGYALQRWMLKQQNRKVTINGHWNDQPPHCLTFENPCLTLKDLEKGQQVIKTKTLTNNISFCFVGRLEREKGVERIIEAFKRLSMEEQSHVDKVHLVGNGVELEYFKALSEGCGITIIFHGFLSHKEVFEIYAKSHVFLLPSTASEGFPKVIAEALNFGCIPVVSNISSIGQYVAHEKNGFLLDVVTSEKLYEQLKRVINLLDNEYLQLIASRYDLVNKFTFSHYNKRIQTEILQN